jgi:hypothetical protein
LSERDANRVAAAVGDLPLAVEQAGALLAETPLTPDTYLRLLRESAERLFAYDPGGLYPVSVTASWTVAFDWLAANHNLALDLLTLVAWCGPAPVPLSLLTDTPDALPEPLRALTDALMLADVTALVHRRSLATLTPHTVQVHRVPAALLRARTREDQSDVGGWAAAVIRLLHAAAPENPRNNPSVWPRWQQLLPHILAATDPSRPIEPVPGEVAWLLDHAAQYRNTRGEPRAALPLARRAHALYREWLGDDHLDTVASANNLAIDLAAVGEHELARALDEDTLTRRRRVLGDDHPDTLTSANSLASRLAALGEHEQARALHEDTLARRRRVLGDDHLDTLTSANSLANRLAALGEHEQARALHEDTLARRRRVLGDDHPDTLTSANNLGMDLAALGEHEQARALHEDTLARRRRVLGDDHPDTLTSANSLGMDLAALGEHEQARALHEDTLARRRRVLGDDHPDTLTSANSLVIDLAALGEHEEARALHEDTLARGRPGRGSYEVMTPGARGRGTPT